MCFSPQRRAIFGHRNFKKWSENVVFCTFSLEHVLLATAACNFWFLLWPHDSAPAALTSLLFDSPDTRIMEKTQHFATSLTFGVDVSSFFWLSRNCIFFLLTLLHLICFSSAFQLSILSEVYYLNFLRWYNSVQYCHKPRSSKWVIFAASQRQTVGDIFHIWKIMKNPGIIFDWPFTLVSRIHWRHGRSVAWCWRIIQQFVNSLTVVWSSSWARKDETWTRETSIKLDCLGSRSPEIWECCTYFGCVYHVSFSSDEGDHLEIISRSSEDEKTWFKSWAAQLRRTAKVRKAAVPECLLGKLQAAHQVTFPWQISS